MNKPLLDIIETSTGIVTFYYMVKPTPQEGEYIVEEDEYEINDVTDIAEVSSEDDYSEKLDDAGRHQYYYFPVFHNISFSFDGAMESSFERFHLNIFVRKA